MSYLSVSRFWDYQNADVYTKSKGHPPWFKHYVHRDRELDKLDPMARLLFYELLGVATRHKNVFEDDFKWLLTETLIDPEEIAKHLPILLEGGWIQASDTPKRSRKPSRKIRDKRRDLLEETRVEEEALTHPEDGQLQKPKWNPRSLGTNPRAVASREKRENAMADFVSRFWDEYPDTDILLDELTDRGCRRDEAEDLVSAERTRRGIVVVGGIDVSDAVATYAANPDTEVAAA